MSKKITDWNLLLKEADEGNKKSEAILWTSLERFLRAMSMRQFGIIIDEVILDTISKIWIKKELYNPELAMFSTWSFAILKNQFIRNRKKRLKRLTRETSVGDMHVTQEMYGFTDDVDVDDIVNDKNIKRMLELIATDSRFNYVRLQLIEGLKYYEIAEQLDIDIQLVKNRVRREKMKLKEALSKELDI